MLPFPVSKIVEKTRFRAWRLLSVPGPQYAVIRIIHTRFWAVGLSAALCDPYEIEEARHINIIVGSFKKSGAFVQDYI